MSTIDYNTFNTLKERMKAKFPVLLEGYLKDANTYLDTIRTNIQDGDLNRIIESAHSLKSGSGILGLSDVHAHAEKLENKSKDMLEGETSQPGELQPCFETLHQAFSDIEETLHAELAQLK